MWGAPSCRIQTKGLIADACLQRETGARAQAELCAVQQELEQEAAANTARVEGLRAALQAQEARSSALDHELRTRPTTQLVSFLTCLDQELVQA